MPRYVSSSGPVRQASAGSLPATPRGSKPTMSNRASSVAGNTLLAASAYCTPEAPGPPGLITSGPTRWAGSVAGSLITGSEKRFPPGWA